MNITVNNENTTNKAHSVFPPSSAERHLMCTPSLVMENLFPNTTSEAAEEGTAAHALGEWKTRKILGLDCPEIRPVSDYDSEEMEECTSGYASYISQVYHSYKNNALTSNCTVMLERSVDFGNIVEGGFGTADCLIVNDKVLHIIDLKYGINKVEATNNFQLRLYALGALNDFSMLFEDIEVIRLTIYQPRVFVNRGDERFPNISTWQISKDDLINWGNIFVKPRARMALSGVGDCNEGKWCKFCKASCICSAKRDSIVAKMSMLDLAQKGDVMSDEDIINVLKNGNDIVNWIKKVQAYAEEKALDGKNWTGFELVEGRGSRVFVSEDAVEDRLAKNNISIDLYDKSFISVAKLEKEIGKKEFKSMLGDLVIKRPGRLTLAMKQDTKAS